MITRNLAVGVLMVVLSTLGPQRASALEKGGGASGGTGWSKKCLDCQNDCDRNYPGGGAPRQTCLNLCKLSGACAAAAIRPKGSPVQRKQ